MVDRLRPIIAGKLLGGFKKSATIPVSNSEGLLDTIQWGLRLQLITKKSKHLKNTVNVEITQKYMKSLNLLPAVAWKELPAWGNDVIKAVACDDVVKNVEWSQNGFTIGVATDWFAKNVLSDIYEQKSQYGTQSMLHHYKRSKEFLKKVKQNQKVVVEFSSPNIAKPFHAGHLRSTVLGNSIYCIYRALGHEVTAINYLGDWGTQFGYLGVGFAKYGSEEKLRQSPMEHLFDVYVKAHKESKEDDSFHKKAMAFFAQMEAGDNQALEFWRKCRELSIDEYKKTYKRFGVEFDFYDGESLYQAKSKDLLQQMELQGLLKTDQETGVKYLDVTDVQNNKSDPNQVKLLKSDGTSLYLTRDIAAFADRKQKYKFDRMHYVVDQGQGHHFIQLVLSCKKLGLISENEPHTVSDYHVQFARVEGMSTRRGDVVFLTDILDEATARMKEIMLSKETTKVEDPETIDRVASTLAVTALIVQDLSDRPTKGYTFSWDRVLSFTGDTGPFLQYQHARLCSLMRTVRNELDLVPDVNIDYNLLADDVEAIKVIVCLGKFDEAVMKACTELEPHFITNYLFDLCHASSKAFSVLNVKDSPRHIAQARLLLFDCVRQTLYNGLKLLGVTPLEKM